MARLPSRAQEEQQQQQMAWAGVGFYPCPCARPNSDVFCFSCLLLLFRLFVGRFFNFHISIYHK